MQDQPTPAPVTVTRSGVCVVDGYGIRIRVERGHLVIADGTGPDRRESRFSRPRAGIRRLVLLGHSGFVSLDALRWMHDVGIGFIHLGSDGRVLVASAAVGVDEPALRRAQAAAWGTPAGLDIARGLLRDKLAGQAAVAQGLPGGDEVAARIQAQVPLLDVAQDQRALMVVEAVAATEYWQGWSGLPVRWARQDAARVPDHWQQFMSRTSPLTSSPRSAADPPNALINYVQSLVEAEARLACLAMGLDPGLGVLHADQRARDSLCLDIQEVLRPEADAFVLNLFTDGPLRASDFIERRDGSVHVLPPLATWLSGTTNHWHRLVAPVVERIAFEFDETATSRVRRVATSLTQSNRSAGRLSRQRRPTIDVSVWRKARPACGECGAPLSLRRKACGACLPTQRARVNAAFAERLSKRQRELHLSGQHPSHSEEAQHRRGRRNAEHGRARFEWDQTHPGEWPAEVFRSQILPKLQDFPITEMAVATSLSVSYCAAIRKGDRVPHPRWWEALRRLGDSDPGG